jgi:hypothetical protein
MLLAVDVHKNFFDIEGIAMPSVLSHPAAGTNGTKIYAPKADRSTVDSNAALSLQIFDFAVA